MTNKVGGSNGKVVCPRNIAGDRTKKRREYPPEQDTRRNTRLSRTALKHNDKQSRGLNGKVVCPRNTVGDRTKKRREYPPEQDTRREYPPKQDNAKTQ